jgi:hypothetical protein
MKKTLAINLTQSQQNIFLSGYKELSIKTKTEIVNELKKSYKEILRKF